MAPFSDMIEWVVDHMGIGEFLPSNWLMDLIAAMACPPNSWLEVVCENVVFLLVGYDRTQMNTTMLETIASHTPAGSSSYTVLQYAQGIQHSECQLPPT
jgi:lysosomal acid lipase/cholesteryl ester hydrolase